MKISFEENNYFFVQVIIIQISHFVYTIWYVIKIVQNLFLEFQTKIQWYTFNNNKLYWIFFCFQWNKLSTKNICHSICMPN